PEGIAIPWELLRDPERGEFGLLPRLAREFVRSLPDRGFDPVAPPGNGPSLNILLVISRPLGPDEDVPFQSVARPLLELFRPHRDHIRLDVLRPPTFEQLTRLLGERPGFYHILHFDGHGTFPDAESGRPGRFFAKNGEHGLLIFEGEREAKREVTGAEFGQ